MFGSKVRLTFSQLRNLWRRRNLGCLLFIYFIIRMGKTTVGLAWVISDRCCVEKESEVRDPSEEKDSLSLRCPSRCDDPKTPPGERGEGMGPKGLEGGGEANPTVTVVLDEPRIGCH